MRVRGKAKDGLTEHQRRVIRDPHYIRRTNLKRRYGITPEEYAAMLAKQKGVCCVCRYAPSSVDKALVVDHSHKTKRVRGLLCHWCNTGLGLFKDSPKLLRLAALYLTKSIGRNRIKRHSPRKVR